MPYADPLERQRVSREYAQRRRAEQRPGDAEYQRETNRRKRVRLRHALAGFKVTSGCAVCGYDSNADALSLDHVNPRYKSGGELAHPRSWAQLVTLTQDPNIQVLCANDHAIKTAREHRERLGV